MTEDETEEIKGFVKDFAGFYIRLPKAIFRAVKEVFQK